MGAYYPNWVWLSYGRRGATLGHDLHSSVGRMLPGKRGVALNPFCAKPVISVLLMTGHWHSRLKFALCNGELEMPSCVFFAGTARTALSGYAFAA